MGENSSSGDAEFVEEIVAGHCHEPARFEDAEYDRVVEFDKPALPCIDVLVELIERRSVFRREQTCCDVGYRCERAAINVEVGIGRVEVGLFVAELGESSSGSTARSIGRRARSAVTPAVGDGCTRRTADGPRRKRQTVFGRFEA